MAENETQLALKSEIGFELLGVEPVPAAWRNATAWQQYWIWSGANIAPINWILGTLGIILGLGLWTTEIILAVGNIIGCGLFGLFTLRGHKTGVDQMVLSRAAFGKGGPTCPYSSKLFLPLALLPSTDRGSTG